MQPTTLGVSWTDHWDVVTLTNRRHELYLARLARTREFMRKADIPVLLILDSNHIFYATGARNMDIFTTRTPARYLLLFHTGPSILYEFVGCEHLAAGLPTIDLIKQSEALSYVSSNGTVREASERLADEITAIIRSVDPTIDKIGVDRFPVPATDALRARGFTLCDAEEPLSAARCVKLPIEIPYLREALQRVDIATQRLEATVKPGMTESEAWAEFHYDLMRKDGQYIVARLFQSGPHTFPYFQECGTRVLEAGDLLCLDTDATGYEGYAVDYSRTFLCGDGRATPEQRQLYALAREQLENNAELLKAGIEYRELAEKAWQAPDENRKSRYYCVGHGLGMAGEFPNIPHHERGTTYPLPGHLEPGMVICLESYVGSEKFGQGVKLEDQFLILDTHVERMSHYQFDARLG
ncbi:MAG: M24 family metallopeptidase [Anaerolineales bacterium]